MKNILSIEGYIRAYICYGFITYGHTQKTDEEVGKRSHVLNGGGITHILSPNRSSAYQDDDSVRAVQ